ncbi:MAG: DNA topoisomerase III [Clostridiales bacterium]|nr:DNA topoisomerase III [Clostridiales bacterium]
MPRKLIVAEKPSVARDIARVLGVRTRDEGFIYNDDYVVTWAIGHLVTLCEPGETDERWQKWNMAQLPMLPDNIPLKVLPKTKKQFSTIKKLMKSKDVTSIICATDSAREGELIFRYIYRMAECKKPVERLWISSMTDEAIRQGFATLKPASEYDSLYESARCRSEADWLVGMNASRAFSLVYNAHLSVGRVQTPTLNLIVKRDLEIENFIPQDYWEIRANFGDYEGLWYNPETKETRCWNKEQAEEIKKAVSGKTGKVEESKLERKRIQPPQLFDLTSLQREANKKLGFSADKTLKVAQSLYETHKLVTYPRTDSRYLPDDMKGKVAATLKRMPQPYADFVKAPEMNLGMHSKRFYDNEKISDHHAIVPTEKVANLSGLSPDEARLYDMIARRLIAIHYPKYEYDAARVMTRVEGHLFRSNGSMPVVEGWRALYRDEKQDVKKKRGGDEKQEGEENPLPKLEVGDERKVEKTVVEKKQTKPPAPHTDASILDLMENAGQNIEDETLREQMKSSGLGTPATRAAVIERLIQVGYARRKGKTIVSTEKGRQLIAVVPEQISSAVTTGKWEKALSAMAAFKDEEARMAKSDRFMQGIRRFSIFLVDAAKNAPRDVHFEKETPKKYAARRTTARKASAAKSGQGNN